MSTYRTDMLHTLVCISMFLLLALTACAQSPSPVTNRPTRAVVSSPTHSLTASPTAATFTLPPTRVKPAPVG